MEHHAKRTKHASHNDQSGTMLPHCAAGSCSDILKGTYASGASCGEAAHRLKDDEIETLREKLIELRHMYELLLSKKVIPMVTNEDSVPAWYS